MMQDMKTYQWESVIHQAVITCNTYLLIGGNGHCKKLYPMELIQLSIAFSCNCKRVVNKYVTQQQTFGVGGTSKKFHIM